MTIGELCRLWTEKGHKLYMVGGCVRDRILGRPTVDYDFATDTVPELTMEILRGAGLRVFPLGLEFGTVATTLNDPTGPVEVQITTFRCRESYSRGSRHPEVVFGVNLEEDLRRRDFTINAMAMDCSGKIIDPLGGRRDLERGLIRTPLDPVETFTDDPLRMLRAFRFAATLGFGMDDMTLNAVSMRHSLILEVSRERWKMEMDRLLTAADPSGVSRNLVLMRETGILLDLFPELSDVFSQDDVPQGDTHTGDIWEHTLDAVSNAVSGVPCVRWGLLLHDIGKPLCRSTGDNGNVHFHCHESAGAEMADSVARRFRFSRKERNCLTFLVRNHMRPVLYSPEWSDRAVRKLARDAGEHLEELLDLAQSDIAAHAEPFASEGLSRLGELRRRLEALAPEVRKRVLPGELGRILMNRIGSDISRAPQVGVILSNLEELVHQGVLPELAPPEVYLEYLEEHPETTLRSC